MVGALADMVKGSYGVHVLIYYKFSASLSQIYNYCLKFYYLVHILHSLLLVLLFLLFDIHSLIIFTANTKKELFLRHNKFRKF